MTCRPLWGLLPLLLLCGCGAIQRQQVEQIKNAARTEMAACHDSPKVAKWRCINAILIRENEALHNPDMDLIQSLAADQDAGRVSDVEAEARHREAIATAEAENQRRRADFRVRNAVTNRLNAETTATYTNMIGKGVEMMEGNRPAVATCNSFGNTVNCVAR